MCRLHTNLIAYYIYANLSYWQHTLFELDNSAVVIMTEKDKDTCTTRCTIYWLISILPQGSEKVLFAVSTYSTLLAIIDQTSSKEAAKDSNNETLFTVSDEIVNVTVAGVSNAVLWNCRDYSITRSFYRRFYIAVVVCLFAYVFIFMTKITKKWITCDCSSFDWYKLASAIYIRISLILIVTSYDIDPWACFEGPSSISYNEFDQTVTLTFSERTLGYQKVAPIVSLIIGILGWLCSIIGQVYFNHINPDEKERKYIVKYNKSADDFEFTDINIAEQLQMTKINEQVDVENYVKMFVL